MRNFLILVVSFIVLSCSIQKKAIHNIFKTPVYPIVPVHDNQNWQYKDIVKDTLVGISLEKANKEFPVNKKTITVAIIDTPIDIRDTYQYFTEANMEKLLDAGYPDDFYSLEAGIEDYVKNYLKEELIW